MIGENLNPGFEVAPQNNKNRMLKDPSQKSWLEAEPQDYLQQCGKRQSDGMENLCRTQNKWKFKKNVALTIQ